MFDRVYQALQRGDDAWTFVINIMVHASYNILALLLYQSFMPKIVKLLSILFFNGETDWWWLHLFQVPGPPFLCFVVYMVGDKVSGIEITVLRSSQEYR